MERTVLFSAPSESVIDKVLKVIFPESLNPKIFAYMPSDGANCPQQYIDIWKGYAERYGAEFRYIDNSKQEAEEERKKLLESNILLITGGNTFALLNNLRKSGLDNTIREFASRKDSILAGFSAGALVLTPTIEICNLPNFDNNLVGLEDLTGLGLVDFEVFPHYSEDKKQLLEQYRLKAKNPIKEISNEDYIVIESQKE